MKVVKRKYRDLKIVTCSDKFFVHWLTAMEVTFVISVVFESFIIVILWLQQGTLVRVDLKFHLVSSTFPR
jgi:ABC-type transport system involved in cytochrome c biogenesis permease subunit